MHFLFAIEWKAAGWETSNKSTIQFHSKHKSNFSFVSLPIGRWMDVFFSSITIFQTIAESNFSYCFAWSFSTWCILIVKHIIQYNLFYSILFANAWFEWVLFCRAIYAIVIMGSIEMDQLGSQPIHRLREIRTSCLNQLLKQFAMNG